MNEVQVGSSVVFRLSSAGQVTGMPGLSSSQIVRLPGSVQSGEPFSRRTDTDHYICSPPGGKSALAGCPRCPPPRRDERFSLHSATPGSNFDNAGLGESCPVGSEVIAFESGTPDLLGNFPESAQICCHLFLPVNRRAIAWTDRGLRPTSARARERWTSHRGAT